ncbi:MAG: NAD-dependent epimerase/dehydratase family protein [Spirochaetaceae bacterium]|nr:NAD-dependent epimerase/dehydratase family protein [Spirochaetaceae bacterium]
MKVLILGGTGVISRAITENLIAGGHDVTLFNRGTKSPAFAKPVAVISGDRSKGELEKAVGSASFDAVIDMICFNRKDAEETVRVFRGKAGQIIITSSIAAYKRPYHSLPIREDAEELFTDASFGYAFHKAELERCLGDIIGKDKLPITIIRPSLTFGIGAPNVGILRQNYGIIERIRRGKPLVMFGDGSTPWTFTFVEDLAKAYAAVLGNPRAFGQAFHATSDYLCRWEDLYLEFGRLAGAEPKIIHISSELLMKAAPNLCSHLYFEKTFPGVFDNTKIRSAAPSFKTTISLGEGCKTLFDWWEKEKPFDPEKDKLEDDLAAAYEKFSAAIAGLYTK